jgi:hypothetical protein
MDAAVDEKASEAAPSSEAPRGAVVLPPERSPRTSRATGNDPARGRRANRAGFPAPVRPGGEMCRISGTRPPPLPPSGSPLEGAPLSEARR